MGLYLRKEEIALAHGQHFQCPQLNDVTSMHTDILFCQPISPALCDDWNVGESTFYDKILLIDQGSIVSLDKTEYANTILILLMFLIAP